MKFPAINGWTALVVVAGIVGVCALVYFKADPDVVGAYSAGFIALAGTLSKMFPGDPPPPPPPPPSTPNAPRGLSILPAAALLLVVLTCGCAAFWKTAPSVLNTAQCALRYRDMPWAEVVLRCGVTKENEDAILDLVGQEKEHDAALRREAACRW